MVLVPPVRRLYEIGRGRSRRLSEPLADRRLGAPGKVDPAVGPAPDVLAVDDRARLLVEDSDPHLGHLARAELLYEPERLPGIGHVVGDEHARLAEIDQA